MRSSKERRTYERWRRQAAKLVAACEVQYYEDDGEQWSRALVEAVANRVQTRGLFNVRRVRAYAERLAIIGDDPSVWADMAEARGRPLAAAWLRRNASRLRARARTVRRLLATLDGRCPWSPGAWAQPSACPHCPGSNCMVCKGTGDNSAGWLPRVEPSPHRSVRERDSVGDRDDGVRTVIDARSSKHHPLAHLVRIERSLAAGLPLPHLWRMTIYRPGARGRPAE